MINELTPVRYHSRFKFLARGEKRYASLVSHGRRLRALRLVHRTATGAVEYGQRVERRYQRLQDLASAREAVPDPVPPESKS